MYEWWRAVIRWPYNKREAGIGSSFSKLGEGHARDMSLGIGSVYTMTVWSVTKLVNERPRTFSVVFVSCTNLSQNPLYQGARFGINIQVTPSLAKAYFSLDDENCSFSSLDAEVG